jgi:oligopeptidase A
VLSYAQNRDLRETMYRAYVSRASDTGPQGGSWDNSQIMAEILTVKQDMAHLLGFSHYAALSLETKMARTVPTVMNFLADLAVKAKPQAVREYAELEAFAAKQDDITMQPWDFAYYSEIAREAQYHYNANAYRAYFPFDHVMQGLFTVVSQLFSLSIEVVEQVPVWHEQVKLYAVYDQAQTLRGYFYIDLYAREKKRGGAWMDDYCARRVTQDGQTQLPIAFLTCNFSPPIGDTPALLLHDDVVTLFHEFGHTLHHLLTQVDYSGVSGISGVMWDAVELPSQFLEHWAYTPEGLAMLGKHYETGEVIPQEMIDRLLAARHFQSAMQMMRQLEFAFFDMRIHSDTTLDTSEGIQAVLDRVRAECAVASAIKENRFQHSFSHIFAGGYAAGYYSYKWAEVLSSDAFTRFEAAGLFDKTEGARFMQEILEQGGTDDADVLFHNYMGRAPQVDALLRHSGIEVADGN